MSKLFTLVFLLILGSSAFAQAERIDLAKTIKQERDLHKLIDTSFGGGTSFRVGDSDFFVADLQITSGLTVTESYLFEAIGDELVFRAVVPAGFSKERKFEFTDGQLIISDRDQDEVKWEVIFKLIQSEM